MGTSEKPVMLLQTFEDHNERLKQLVGKDYTPATLKRYQTSIDHTSALTMEVPVK